MGVIICVNGEIETDASPEVMEEFLKIVNDRREKAFEADGQALSFMYHEYDGYDPDERFVLKPLRELVRLAKENGVRLDGYIQVDSDWSDYDNLAVNVSEDGLDTYVNEKGETFEEIAEELLERYKAARMSGLERSCNINFCLTQENEEKVYNEYSNILGKISEASKAGLKEIKDLTYEMLDKYWSAETEEYKEAHKNEYSRYCSRISVAAYPFC